MLKSKEKIKENEIILLKPGIGGVTVVKSIDVIVVSCLLGWFVVRSIDSSSSFSL